MAYHPMLSPSALHSIDEGLKGVVWESPQGVSIGTTTCSIMGVIFGLMVLLDLNKLWMDFQMMRANVGSMWQSLRANKVSNSQVNLQSAVDSSP